MNFFDNITRRRPRTHTENTDESTDNKILDGTTNSLPEISDDENNDELEKLRNQMDSLALQLNSAHSEIESLTLENNNLRQLNKELIKKNDLYKQVTFNSPIKKNKMKTPTPKKDVKLSHNNIMESKQTQTEEQLETQVLGKKEQLQKQQVATQNNTIPVSKSNSASQRQHKKQLYILSCHSANSISAIAKSTLSAEYEKCHFLTPHCGIRQQLIGLKEKLHNFTMDDFCVILIGHADFETTRDYFDIIFDIRKTIEEINHTNIIICLPTFKYTENITTLHNWRVENFNNLLYLDVITHEHVWLLDSNKNLCYDSRSFYTRTGLINNDGMMTIFRDLSKLMDYIHSFNKHNGSENDSENRLPLPQQQRDTQDELFFL